MGNYMTLVNILDEIRKEAPPEYKSYRPLPSEFDKINQARSAAFVHLFLKVKFGLLDFGERISYVTSGVDDAGIDGYFIDTENKRIYFIQAKFRVNEENFEAKEIQLQEILKMDVDRIVKGNTCYEDGRKYNGKIQNMLRQIQAIRDIARYEYRVIILANLKKVTDTQLKRLIGGVEAEVFDFERSYRELVFPVVSGTYYAAGDVYVYLDLSQKFSGESKIRYKVETESIYCEIRVVFVPTIEIAKIMHKYRNSILKYNPRSYLDLSRNPVNSQIARTIREKSTNEFALFNNGITLLSDETGMQDLTGVQNIAQLKLTNPQIINGGQTAYTLCKIYEDATNNGDREELFKGKEVLLKIITLFKQTTADEQRKLELIESISKATNQQTAVTEADRKSNDKAQIELQKKIFEEFGCFYERKRGEFWNGLQDVYINEDQIIDRETFLRICVACNGLSAEARGSSEAQLFRNDRLYATLCDLDKTRLYFFGHLCYLKLNQIESTFQKDTADRHGIINYGNSLRYGKFAVVSVCSKEFASEVTDEKIMELADSTVEKYLSQWLDFERRISKLEHNKGYFIPVADADAEIIRYEMNYANYYKGRTLNSDLASYFA
jgi:hypothetical protein